jgi:molybdenum cofactor biosynthesis enzyme MoaA
MNQPAQQSQDSASSSATLDATAHHAVAPRVALRSLDTLWFQVAGTVCNLACSHCFISCSPTNHTHDFLSLKVVRRYLDEGANLGVKEYYFTGGEPFLNPDMEAILEATLKVGPATVLTNGLLLDTERCQRLATLAAGADYSLDLRISLDGYDAATNDPIRGAGTFERILEGASAAERAGLTPVMTVTEVHLENSTNEGRQRFLDLLREQGIARPRLKILPIFQIGAEAERGGAYESWQHLAAAEAENPDQGWDHLQCSSCRMVTDQGVWVCPILVNEPEGRMGETLADTLNSYPMEHSACWTCHVYGVSCRT